MKHKHRIVPGHRGGTYEPSNVVMLTREEHGEAHWRMWCEDGHEEDLWAAQLLGHPEPDISGENNPAKRPEVRKRISEGRTGQKASREKIAAQKKLYREHPEKHPMWKGGITRDMTKYQREWNQKNREERNRRARERYRERKEAA